MNTSDQDAQVISHLREQLRKAQKRNDELVTLLRLGYEMYQVLAPNLGCPLVLGHTVFKAFGKECVKLLDIKDED